MSQTEIPTKKSNLEIFAEDELRRAGLFDPDSDYGGMLGEAVMRLIRCFADEGHSGFSASMATNLFDRLSRFEPITPLTGDDDEWNEVFNGEYQNRRCPHVFKDSSGTYDSEGRIFRDPSGMCFQNRDSRVQITFPYMPKREYIDVEAENSQ